MTFKKIILIFTVHLLAMALCFLVSTEDAQAKKKTESAKSQVVLVPTKADTDTLIMKARKYEKVLLCTDEKVQKVRVTFGRLTTLNFPVAPKEVLPGAAVFDFKQIRNDLNIIALSPHSKTNVAVYLQERRCSLDLVTVPSGGDDNLSVRDPAEKQFEVRFQ